MPQSIADLHRQKGNQQTQQQQEHQTGQTGRAARWRRSGIHGEIRFKFRAAAGHGGEEGATITQMPGKSPNFLNFRNFFWPVCVSFSRLTL